jgi:hypothetical protein
MSLVRIMPRVRLLTLAKFERRGAEEAHWAHNPRDD